MRNKFGVFLGRFFRDPKKKETEIEEQHELNNNNNNNNNNNKKQKQKQNKNRKYAALKTFKNVQRFDQYLKSAL